MDFIIGYLERYEVGLLEYKEILRSIHGWGIVAGCVYKIEGGQ